MINLSRLDGKSVALVLNLRGRELVWPGRGSYQTDGKLGKVLRICFGELDKGTCGTEFLIRETQWQGTFVDGARYGCDYMAGITLHPK